MNLITLEILQKLLELEIKLGGYEIEKFKKEFDNNPGIALDWSYHLFERVALKQEAEYLLDIIRKNKGIFRRRCFKWGKISISFNFYNSKSLGWK